VHVCIADYTANVPVPDNDRTYILQVYDENLRTIVIPQKTTT